MDDRLDELEALREQALLGGGDDRIERQHEKGKLTARERIEYLLDDGTFTEFDQLRTHHAEAFDMPERKIPGDGVVTGYGEINGRTVYLFAHDFTVFGGSLGKVFAEKVCKIMDSAMEVGAPVIGLNDSAGARIQEGVDSLAGYADVFHRNQRASGVVPQISAIMGPCAGGAVYSPSITDFILMVEGSSYMYITGPGVTETVTGESVTHEELGGAVVHSGTTGIAQFAGASEEAVLDQLRQLLSYLPQNNLETPPRVQPPGDDPKRSVDELRELMPDDPQKPYDVTDVIRPIVDAGSFFEVGEVFAQNLVVGFARLDGRTVGVVANQPRVNAGTLTVDASIKGARFVRFCDAFNIPLVTFVDVPGYMPGTDQEHSGIIRHGAKLLYAYSEATVPLLSIVLRKAYGGAYCVMSSKHIGGDVNYAWPTAEIAVMGPRGAVNVLYRKEIAEADEPDALRDRLIDEYRSEFANPFIATDRGYLDDVIDPADSRVRLIEDLEVLERKRETQLQRKHGNIPL